MLSSCGAHSLAVGWPGVRESLGPSDHARQVQRVLLYRIEGDKLRECWLYDEDQRFVDQLWTDTASADDESPR
jgi:hypothetical protein